MPPKHSYRAPGLFPSDDAATKLIWLALRNITEEWGRAANHWKPAMNQFAILYEDRFTKSVKVQ
jgi:transposase-like protein